MSVVPAALTLLLLAHSVRGFDYRVAVCVTGQTGRLLISSLLNLTRLNQDIYFSLVYVLQHARNETAATAAPIYNTDEWKSYSAAPLSRLPWEEVERVVTGMYKNSTNTDVTLMRNDVVSKKEWQVLLGRGRLNLIEQYEERQHTILNMYNHQRACIRHIQSLEHGGQDPAASFDYIINTREDIYFYHDLNLTSVITHYFRSTLHSKEASGVPSCGMLYRSCLSWSGVGMRLQIYARAPADTILANRITFYNDSIHGLEEKDYFLNPEIFELRQLRAGKVQHCAVPVSELPVVAARHTYNGSFCLPKFETIHRCYPSGSKEFVEANQCL